MGNECLSRERIRKDINFVRDPEATHIRIEGKDFVQYKCNPHPELPMMKISSDVKGFVVYERKFDGRVFSYGARTIGPENPTTFYYQA